MKINIIFLVIGIVLGVLGIALYSSGSLLKNRSSDIDLSAVDRSHKNIDAHFIEQMIPHHEDAVVMAELALTYAKTNEVKQLSENIIASQTNEIDQMREWYLQWFGKEVPSGDSVMNHHTMHGDSPMHMGLSGDSSDVSRLVDSEDFDKAFVEHMIPHHQMAVMMADMLKQSTTRQEMRDLADDIIEEQSKEIDQMREWLRSW